jgi:hypothetical protein
MVALTASPSVHSKAHSPADVPLARYKDGSVFAMSLSQPGVTYAITLEPLSCTCAGFTHRGQCCHSTAALARFAPPCFWCGSRQNVEVWRNGWDDSEMALCRSCFTPKEVK